MIHKASKENHKELVQLAKQSIYTKDFSNTVIFSSKAAYEKGWIRMYTENGKILGFTCVRHKIREPVTVLYFITVDENEKYRGIGKILMRDIQKQSPHKTIHLNVMKTNQEALKFYISLGFKIISEDAIKGQAYKLELRW